MYLNNEKKEVASMIYTKHKYKIVYYFILSPALSEGEGVKIGLFYISVWYYTPLLKANFRSVLWLQEL
jgi:hypothetical protein